MRVPLSWLREFVPVEADADEIASRLSLTGLAVEEVVRMGAGISGVVVGEVLEVAEHPDADNLMLVRATDGGEPRAIVCGARNYEVGDRVPMALPGARLPTGMEIGRRVVRGATSDGMLCSARELDLSDDHSGILILDRDAPLGKDLAAALDLDDVVFDIDVTPNRPDCLSVVGVAREVAAIFGLPLTVPQPVVAEGDRDVNDLAAIAIEDARGCPRYVARVIDGVTPARSPWWLRRRIMAAGMRPISNIVDVTNFVMLERGQPLHAFDLDRLRGAAIVVRKPARGERDFATLDDLQRPLDRTDVMICDAEGPIAIGGVMGGADTEVSDATTRILLESAAFDPIRIARTSRRLGLRTEASTRFERGVDATGARAAADRAMQLFIETAGGSVARGAIDVYPKPPKPKAIRLRANRANELIGIVEPIEEMAESLRSLGCEVSASRSSLRVVPPSWRPDLRIEEDLVEEVARLYGYDRVPETLPSGARTGGLTPDQRWRRHARRLLLGAGLNEAMTLSLLPATLADRLGLAEDHPLRRAPRLANPLSEDESVLRPTLVWGLLLAAQRNVARRVMPVRLFEIGTVFGSEVRDDCVPEHRQAAWVLAGSAHGSWHAEDRPLDLFDAKGVLEALMAGMGIGDWAVERLEASGWAAVLHPGRAARVRVGERTAGYVAELHPRIADALELPGRTAVGLVDLDLLAEVASEGAAPALPRFPPVVRDIAVIAGEDVPAVEVQATIRTAGGALLTSVELFDVYRGDPVPPGSVSLAFSLAFRDQTRTLTDADADEAFHAIVEAVRAAGWSVRD